MVKLFEALLRVLGFKNLIRIPGATFHTLSNEQVALMIEGAVFGENDLFDPGALHEFMLVPNRSTQLEQLRVRIERIALNNASGDCPDGLLTKAGMAELRDLVSELRQLNPDEL